MGRSGVLPYPHSEAERGDAGETQFSDLLPCPWLLTANTQSFKTDTAKGADAPIPAAP